ncbi:MULTISPECIES: thioredoxin [Anaerosinus]
MKITKSNFDAEVIHSDIPVLLDFWAEWCTPCKMLSPIIHEIANENTGKIKVGKVNVDEEPELATQFQVMSIPMLILFKEGKAVNTSIGFMDKEAIKKFLK